MSNTADPVSGGWTLLRVTGGSCQPNLPRRLPKVRDVELWREPGPKCLFPDGRPVSEFHHLCGVRVFALDRASMLSGGPANAIAFTIPPAGLGPSYSLLAANLRNGSAPPVGEDEFLLAIDRSSSVALTQVKGWRFHVDFGTPANSTLGMGANHSPNAVITVNSFVKSIQRPCLSRILHKSWIPWAINS